MPDAMTDVEKEKLQQAINESGFPLQLGLASLANSSREWRVILTEHPWQDPQGESEKFIDIVLRGHGQGGPLRLVTECKRAKDTEWIFLREPSNYGNNGHRSSLRARMAANYVGMTAPVDEWVDVQFEPRSPEALFCVVRKNNQRSQELLEKTAAEIARATDALAHQELLIHHAPQTGQPNLNSGMSRLYIPVIVTTAKMSICDADYDSVDLETGEVTGAVSVPSPVVRFRKSFGSDGSKMASMLSIESFAKQSERSVLVIQADAFESFLQRAELAMTTDRQLMAALYAEG
jgi:hypothetical protein